MPKASTKKPVKKRGRPKKAIQKPVKKSAKKQIVKKQPEKRTAAIFDRMLRYKRNPPCPECDAHPVVCMMRREKYAAFRCRECGHRWEVDNRVDAPRYVVGKEGNPLFKLFAR